MGDGRGRGWGSAGSFLRKLKIKVGIGTTHFVKTSRRKNQYLGSGNRLWVGREIVYFCVCVLFSF